MDFKEIVIENLEKFVEENFVAEGGVPLKLAPYQAEFIRSVLRRDHSKHCFVSSTRVGKTEAASCLAVLLAIVYDGEEVCIVAPRFKQSMKMFSRIKNYFMSNKKLMMLVDTSRAFRRDEIWLKNGSVLRCLSAGAPEGLLGFGATVLIVDETGSIPDSVIKTRILRMLAASKAKNRLPLLILLGTPHNRNFLFEAWNSNDFKKYHVTWKDGVESGILDKDEVEYYRRVMSDREFRVWFEAEWLGEEEGLFDIKDILKCMCITEEKKPMIGYEYYAGLDIARFGDDESVFAVIKVPEGADITDALVDFVYYSYRSKRPLNDIIGWALNLVERWRPKLLVVEETGLGAGVLDVLKEKLGSRVISIKLVGRERVSAYLDVVRLIREGRLRMMRNDEKLRNQFGSYEVKYTSDGRIRIVKNPNMKDDIVDALTFAVYGFMSEKRESFYVADFILESGVI